MKRRDGTPYLDWALLRPVGNSLVVRLSVLFPIVGYFILLNQDVVGWLELDPTFTAFGLNSSWRLPYLFYGLTFIAGASLIYTWRCPALVKLYGSAAEYVGAELDYHYASNHQKLKRDAVNAMLPHKKLDITADIAHALSSLYPPGASRFSDSQARSNFSEVLAIEWKLFNRSRRKSKILCATLYALGFLILAIPSLITVLEVTAALLSKWCH